MQIQGIIEEVVYRNEENSYSVVVIESGEDYITCVGKFPIINVGDYVDLTGEYVKHKKFGQQFQVSRVSFNAPNTKEGIIKYLSSGLIYGVGPVTAMNIVSKFGLDTLQVIEFSPEKLSSVRGVSAKKAEEIYNSFHEVKAMQNAVMLMQSFDISTNMAIKIYNTYGERTEGILKTNPYQFVEDIDGVGFFTADSIAKKIGVKIDSVFRIRAGILHVLREASDKSGNTFVYVSALKGDVAKLLGIDGIDNEIENILDKMVLDVAVKRFDYDGEPVVARIKYYNIEKVLATNLKLLSHDTDNTNINVDSDILAYEQFNNIKMHEAQKDAVRMAVNNGVSIITGGPGTGKTTIVKCILQIFKSQGKRVKLLAPTGRASKRLSESTNFEASTIHRALNIAKDDSNNIFTYNAKNKLPYDVFIIDEVSMVDVVLAYHTLRAIPRHSQIVFVGDKDQLASVGAGNFLKDMLDSKKFASVSLTQIYRQKENSLIITNAHAINNGQMPNLSNQSTDFFFESHTDPDAILNSVINMCTTRIPKFLNIDSSKIQVLAPMKNGTCGIDNINKQLQNILNPPSIKKAEIEKDGVIYRVGDRVMQTTNNYDKEWTKEFERGEGVFNGDIGTINSIEPKTDEVVVDFEDGRTSRYSRMDINELMLSYAITIHKSQGSEFDVVVIPIYAGPPMLFARNLLYTAVTRAKKMVVLVGNTAQIQRMVHNNYTVKRNTMLKYFLTRLDTSELEF